MTPYYQLIHGDNLETLKQLKADGQRFDLVELDGPYMAGLEDWDNLTEAQYIQHYADRLTLVRDILQPWGVVFVFGYPEGCAEIKSWAHRSGTLYLRRWLTWYKQVTAHKGRKVENILLFAAEPVRRDVLCEFGEMLRQNRIRRGWTLHDVGRAAQKEWWHRGGIFYFETGRNAPSVPDYQILKRVFEFGNSWDVVINTAYILGNYEGLTDVDYIGRTYPEDTKELNDSGLRSKPVQLYLDLFRPTIPPTDHRAALILYGGSGNAGIAAAALGYDVTICETDPARCEAIQSRWDRDVIKWQQRARAIQGALFAMPEPEQIAMDLAA